MELGRRLQSQGDIKAAEDIFFLPYADAIDFFNGHHRPTLRKQLYKNQDYYLSYRNFKKPNEIRKRKGGNQAQAHPASDTLQGVGCAPGLVEGVVCAIQSIHEIEKLKAGTILVTEFVDPAWTLSFAQVKGLITETGGVLSHGAVIAREYGFPAILAVTDATKKLRDGMRIRMDGDNGTIQILEDP
jgi:pyruvate,water dikinase